MAVLSKRKYYQDWIAIVDLGSPYTQLIARRIRELKVYAKILQSSFKIDEFKSNPPKGIILSGSDCSSISRIITFLEQEVFSFRVPVLGIDCGIYLLAKMKGDKIKKSKIVDFENTVITILQKDNNSLFYKLPDKIKTWMNKKYTVKEIDPEFKITAVDKENNIIAVYNEDKHLYGLQFHPEVSHTEYGKDILFNFVRRICHCSPEWTNTFFIKNTIDKIKKSVGNGKVVAGVSGGIDSLVAALLTYKAIGDQLHCIFINTGLMRKNEEEEIKRIFNKFFNLNLNIYDYKEVFVKSLERIVDPEEKRKIVGNLFINIFEEKAKKIGGVTHLLQGTLYSDVIESTPGSGLTAKIKSHHNVGGLPEKMNLKLLEPLKDLFKDEVRRVGRSMGLPDRVIWRQPFPGPGLAIRIVGEVTEEKLSILREADEIIRREIDKEGWNKKLWQYFGVLLPVKSVGVTAGLRTYDNTLVLRMVSSDDGMTAEWANVPYEILADLSNRIIEKVQGINRVLYDISSKPPATIEWE